MFTEEIPDYGDLFTLQDWLDCCNDRSFIDYDGFGCASDGKLMTSKCYYPSERNNLPESTTHIIWFNS